MSVLAHKWVASGALKGKPAFARARVCVVLHGIMGSGRNWMTAARQIVKRAPHYKVLLVDHRGHGENGTRIEGPHDLDACGRDVVATVRAATGAAAPTPSTPEALLACGTAPMVLGHSFGGKVALAYARNRVDSGHRAPNRTWLLDSNPQHARGASASTTKHVLGVLKQAVKLWYPTKNDAIDSLVLMGLDDPTARWLAMTTKKDADGRVVFTYDVEAVEAMYASYNNSDCTLIARELAATDQFGLVVAGRGRMGLFDPKSDIEGEMGLPGSAIFNMADAGHNVHVDDLPGLLDILLNRNAADWS